MNELHDIDSYPSPHPHPAGNRRPPEIPPQHESARGRSPDDCGRVEVVSKPIRGAINTARY